MAMWCSIVSIVLVDKSKASSKLFLEKNCSSQSG